MRARVYHAFVMLRVIKIYLMAGFMLLLSSLWAGGMAMASYCAVTMSQSQKAQLCGNGSGGAVTLRAARHDRARDKSA